MIRDVGIQVKTVYLGGRSVSRFIDRSKIQDIIINEAITMMHIRVYMAIIVEGQDKMVVVFQVSWQLEKKTSKQVDCGTNANVSLPWIYKQNLLPRLNVLLQAYHGARSIIFHEKDHSDFPLEFS